MKLALAFLALILLARPALAGGPELRRSEKDLEFSIRIPDGYDRARGGLLAFALHGRGGSQADFMKMVQGYDFLKHAAVVAPQAPNAAKMWDVTNLAAMADLVREVQGELHPARTIFFGHSAGGFFSVATALTASKRIHAAIPVGSGLPDAVQVPSTDVVKAIAFYVIHGDKDSIVPVQRSRDLVKALETAGVKHFKYEEQPGVEHIVDAAAVRRGFEWVESVLGPVFPELPEAQATERLKALEKSIKAKDWEAVVSGFEGLDHASRRHGAKLAALAKAQLACPEESVAVAAVEALGRLGAEAIPALKTVSADREDAAAAAAVALARTGVPAAAEPLLALLRGKSESVAIAAAQELRHLRGDAATAALIAGLKDAEAQKTPDGRKDAILLALKRVTGQSFATWKEWRKWAGS